MLNLVLPFQRLCCATIHDWSEFMRNILYSDSKKCTVYVIDLLLNVTHAPINVNPQRGGSGICGIFDHQLHPHPGDFD